jgi:hypothetical protein
MRVQGAWLRPCWFSIEAQQPRGEAVKQNDEEGFACDCHKDPKVKIPGAKMAFAGIKNEKDADDLWSFLEQFGPDGKKKWDLALDFQCWEMARPPPQPSFEPPAVPDGGNALIFGKFGSHLGNVGSIDRWYP